MIPRSSCSEHSFRLLRQRRSAMSMLLFLSFLLFFKATTITASSVKKPTALWIPAHESKYQKSTRSSSTGEISQIVLQLTLNPMSSSIEATTGAKAQSNMDVTHYMIANKKSPWSATTTTNSKNQYDNVIVQMIEDKDIVLPVNPTNSKSIFVSHESALIVNSNNGTVSYQVNGGFDFEMYQKSAQLVAHLCQKYNVPIDRQHIIGRDELLLEENKKRGPGANWDWDLFMSLVRNAYNHRCAFTGLKKNDVGRTVLVAQYLLNVTRSGVFDNETAEVLFEYQLNNYIASYGVMMPENWSEMLRGYNIVRVGDLDVRIQLLQYLLAERFYDIDPKLITGKMDKKTMAALKQFKIDHVSSSNRLTDTKSAILDFETWAVLITGCLVKDEKAVTKVEEVTTTTVPIVIGSLLGATLLVISIIFYYNKNKAKATQAKATDTVSLDSV